MESKTFTAPDISCGHCVRTIEEEVRGLGGVTYVQADVNSRQVTVNWEPPADWERIRTLLHEIGYPPQELIQLN